MNIHCHRLLPGRGWRLAATGLAALVLLCSGPALAQENEKPAAPTGGWRLADSPSAYLRLHAGDPVEWYPWGEEALTRARELDRPVFLSTGYASCHWCHVMRRECFSNTEIAQLLNEGFVPIKVDREELPQVDDVYMAAVQLLTGQGGWPLSVFLTPAGEPFFGGTYFPPEPAFGRPGFKQVLANVRDVWEKDRAQIHKVSSRISSVLAETRAVTPQEVDARSAVHSALASALARADAVNGGLQGAPKFPMPRLLVLMASAAALDGNAAQRDHALLTLRHMASGGLLDQVGGGFQRYTVDAEWRVPHFEKMLYSQTLLARCYLEVGRLTVQEDLLEVGRRTLDAMLRDFLLDVGAFAASWDADSEEEEGTYYLWTPAHVRAALGGETADAQQLDVVLTYLGISAEGNFEGQRTVPQQAVAAHEIARKHAIPSEQVRRHIDTGLAQMLAARAQRPAPFRDAKVILGWNATAVSALAQGARVLGTAAYLEAAQRALAFADRTLAPDSGFLRSWSNGTARYPAQLQDVALHLQAHLDLYEATFDSPHVARARRLVERIEKDYGPTDEQRAEGHGGFYETLADAAVLIPRHKEFADDAMPSGNAVLARCLLRLHHLTAAPRYRALAEGILREGLAALNRKEGQGPELMLGALEWISPVPEVVVYGDLKHPLTHAFLRELRRSALPFVVAAHRAPGAPGEQAAQVLPILEGRTGANDRPTAYLCLDFVCQQPLNDPMRFAIDLEKVGKPAPAPGTEPGTAQPGAPETRPGTNAPEDGGKDR